MSALAQLVSLAGKLPSWKVVEDQEKLEARRKKRNAYMRIWQRGYRRRKAKK